MTMQANAPADPTGEPPLGCAHIIKRPRLTKILDETEARIILLCAPAGYGKTTLAREWVATRSEPVLWYSGGPAMADVAALAVDLAELFGGGPDSEHVERVRFLAARGEAPRVLAKVLAAAAPGPETIIVIDDYHLAAASADANALVRELVTQGRSRTLVASRIRPRWIDPRSVIYGEALVLDARQLAFSQDEADEVLPSSEALRTQAGGWPAVIGLAALRGGDLGTSEIERGELYDFLARDLYEAASPNLQTGLIILALAGEIDAPLANAVLGSQWQAVTHEATERGFVTGDASATTLTMHPLLRHFLLGVLHRLPDTSRDNLAAAVVQALGDNERWDNSLAALEVVPLRDIATLVFERALPKLLELGRVETVKRWIRLGAAERFNSPVFLLAEAEVAVRESRLAEGKLLAERAARALEGDLAARAHLAAARAAHLSGQTSAIVTHTQNAFEAATDSSLKHESAWLAFLAACESQDPNTAAHLDELTQLEYTSPEFELRIACAQGLHQFEMGEIQGAIATTRGAEPLMSRVRDPLLRTTYLNLMGHSLLVYAAYDEAERVSAAMIEEAGAHGIDFVIGYALLMRAGCAVGQRKLRAANRTLLELQRRNNSNDANVSANSTIIAARIAIASGALDRAHALLAGMPPRGIPPSLLAEFYAYRGLVEAAAGRGAKANRHFVRAQERSTYVEASKLTDLGRAVNGLMSQPIAGVGRALTAVRNALEVGYRDGVVTACRAFPPLVSACTADEDVSQALVSLLAASHDADLARSAGLHIPRELRRGDGLSNREREVLALLRDGRTNREIAKTLFISESTTKVHIRHIFEKLGVHSRAEAAAAIFDDD